MNPNKEIVKKVRHIINQSRCLTNRDAKQVRSALFNHSAQSIVERLRGVYGKGMKTSVLNQLSKPPKKQLLIPR